MLFCFSYHAFFYSSIIADSFQQEKDTAKKSETSSETNNGTPYEEKKNQNDSQDQAETELSSARSQEVHFKEENVNNTAGASNNEGFSSEETNGVTYEHGMFINEILSV